MYTIFIAASGAHIEWGPRLLVTADAGCCRALRDIVVRGHGASHALLATATLVGAALNSLGHRRWLVTSLTELGRGHLGSTVVVHTRVDPALIHNASTEACIRRTGVVTPTLLGAVDHLLAFEPGSYLIAGAHSALHAAFASGGRVNFW